MHCYFYGLGLLSLDEGMSFEWSVLVRLQLLELTQHCTTTYIYTCMSVYDIYVYIYIYQGAPGLIRVKTGLVFLRSRFDWVTFVKYYHGFARVGFGQVSS